MENFNKLISFAEIDGFVFINVLLENKRHTAIKINKKWSLIPIVEQKLDSENSITTNQDYVLSLPKW